MILTVVVINHFAVVFIESLKQPPKELILDFDATDAPVHGHQLGMFYHGYYIGIARNPRLEFISNHLMETAIAQFEDTGEKQRVFCDLAYAADTWKYTRRVIAKAEYSAMRKNPRFIVTSLSGESRLLYENHYCSRGEAENRIKAQQFDLFADRTSCMNWVPNQVHLLSDLACTLIIAIRRLCLKGTALYSASHVTLRLKLFKIGAIILKNTRRIQLMLSSAYPYQKIFYTVHADRALLDGNLKKLAGSYKS